MQASLRRCHGYGPPVGKPSRSAFGLVEKRQVERCVALLRFATVESYLSFSQTVSKWRSVRPKCSGGWTAISSFGEEAAASETAGGMRRGWWRTLILSSTIPLTHTHTYVHTADLLGRGKGGWNLQAYWVPAPLACDMPILCMLRQRSGWHRVQRSCCVIYSPALLQRPS